MLKRISHTFIHVLDQDEALDFYVGKLGMVVHTDADLGVMRFLTVNLPDQPDVELVLMLPGPPAYDDATAAQIRELVAKGGRGRRRDLRDRRLSRHLREPTGGGRRVHAGADGALLRDRLRAARSVREPDPLHPTAGRDQSSCHRPRSCRRNPDDWYIARPRHRVRCGGKPARASGVMPCAKPGVLRTFSPTAAGRPIQAPRDHGPRQALFAPSGSVD